MAKITEQAKNVIAQTRAKNESKLVKQMDYYNQLKKKGLTKSQSYTLGTVSAV